MATLQQLEQALVGAHRAGDLDAARKLANAVKAAREDIGNQIPGAQVPSTLQAPAEPGLIDKAIGTGEAALSLITGATGGAAGLVGGTLKGVAQAIGSGNFGTPEAANAIEQSAAQGAQALTYAPRTPSGKEQAGAVGQVLQAALPVLPLTGDLAALSVASQPARALARNGAAAVLDKARGLLPGEIPTAAPGAVAEAAPVVAAAPVAPMAATDLAATARRAGEGGIGSGKASKILAEQAAPNPETVKAAERLGVQDYLQPDHVTTNEAYRQVVAAIKSNPQSAVALAEREGLARVAQRAADLIDEAGGTRDLSSLDQSVKSKLQATQAELDAKAEGLYKQLRQGVPARAQVEAPNVLAFIEQRAADLGGEANLSGMERMILRKLSPKDVLPDRAAAPKNGPSYALLDDVRRDLTAAKYKKQGPFKDADVGLIKALEKRLMEDQRAAVEPYGMLDVFDAARTAVRARKGIEDDLSALFGKTLDGSMVGSGQVGLAGAVAVLAKGDTSRLIRLLQSVPEDMRQEVVASGLSTVFRNAATRGEMDFTGYMKWYEGLKRNRRAYAAVMSTLPMSARKQLEALYRVSAGISESLNRRIKTGALSTIKQEMMGADGLMEGLYSVARRAGAGMAAEAVTTPLGLPGAGLSAGIASALTKGKTKALTAVDELVASPEFAQLVKTQAGTKVEVAAVKSVARSQAFRRVVRAVGNHADMSDGERWILQAMQPRPQQDQPDTRTLH